MKLNNSWTRTPILKCSERLLKKVTVNYSNKYWLLPPWNCWFFRLPEPSTKVHETCSQNCWSATPNFRCGSPQHRETCWTPLHCGDFQRSSQLFTKAKESQGANLVCFQSRIVHILQQAECSLQEPPNRRNTAGYIPRRMCFAFEDPIFNCTTPGQFNGELYMFQESMVVRVKSVAGHFRATPQCLPERDRRQSRVESDDAGIDHYLHMCCWPSKLGRKSTTIWIWTQTNRSPSSYVKPLKNNWFRRKESRGSFCYHLT